MHINVKSISHNSLWEPMTIPNVCAPKKCFGNKSTDCVILSRENAQLKGILYNYNNVLLNKLNVQKSLPHARKTTNEWNPQHEQAQNTMISRIEFLEQIFFRFNECILERKWPSFVIWNALGAFPYLTLQYSTWVLVF